LFILKINTIYWKLPLDKFVLLHVKSPLSPQFCHQNSDCCRI